jgi:15-cis-phytoene synthase
MTGPAWAASKFASSTHAAVGCDALKDFDNAGWVASLPASVRAAWVARIRAIRLADRVAENQTLHVVRITGDGVPETLDGAAPEAQAAWERYLAALRDYHDRNLGLETLADHRRMLDRLSGSLLQLVPFLRPHHFEAARAFGVVDQFFNNLRDLAEDAAQGICYFPEDVLVRFGLRREDVVSGRCLGTAAWRELMVYWLDEYLPQLERDAARFDTCDDLHPSVARLRSEFRARYARILDTFCAVDFDFERFAQEYWNDVGAKANPADAISAAWRTGRAGSRPCRRAPRDRTAFRSTRSHLLRRPGAAHRRRR